MSLFHLHAFILNSIVFEFRFIRFITLQEYFDFWICKHTNVQLAILLYSVHGCRWFHWVQNNWYFTEHDKYLFTRMFFLDFPLRSWVVCMPWTYINWKQRGLTLKSGMGKTNLKLNMDFYRIPQKYRFGFVFSLSYTYL